MIATAKPKELRRVGPEHEEITRGFEKPIGQDKLDVIAKAGMKFAIVCDDITRPTPVHKIVPTLIEKLDAAGIRSEDIYIIVGVGTHPRHTCDQNVKKLGQAVLDRFNVISHDIDGDLIYLGETSRGTPVHVNRRFAEADVKLGIGNLAPHPFSGYGGGPKTIVGICGRETIMCNHRFVKDDRCQLGLLKGNPVYEDIVEIARKASLHMIVNTLLDSEGRIARLFVGDPVEAHGKGVEVLEKACKVILPTLAEVVVTSSFPFDDYFYQSWKGIFSAALTCKQGGTIILSAPCRMGVQDEHYKLLTENRLFKITSDEIYEKVEKGEIKPYIIGLITYKLRSSIGDREVIIVTRGIEERKIRDMGFRYASDLDEAFQMAKAKHRTANLVVLPFGAETLPIVSGQDFGC